jgi:UDP-glucose 4-epimerase
MRILCTGISGFIGQHLADALLADGHEIHGLYEHEESRAKNPSVEMQHVVSLTRHPSVAAFVEAIQPDIVLHLASRSEVALSFDNYVEVTNVNYLATVNLAEACRRLVPGLKAFIMASTMEVFGNAWPFTGERAFTEVTPPFPMAPYAVAKLACEKYLAYMGYAYQFPYIILRQTNTYGRRDNSFFIVERVISQMLAGDTCDLGVAWPTRNFLHIHDLVKLYRTLLEQMPLGETFVTGPDHPVTIGELARLIAAKLAWDGQINWGTAPVRAAEVPYLNSVATKAKEWLGWESKIDLDEGLDRTIAIWRTNPKASMVPDWVARV